MESPPSLVKIRGRRDRAAYSPEALKATFLASPVGYVAFSHSGRRLEGPDGEERRRILNIPLLCLLREWEDELVVYLHTYAGARIAAAIDEGTDEFSITTSKIDGLILSPTGEEHSFNYRSACIYAHQPVIVSDYEEKKNVLIDVVNSLTGYDRTQRLGPASDDRIKQTVIIRLSIESFSCKQRTGGHQGGVAPCVVDEEDTAPGGPQAHEFTGVVPCWTQFGDLTGVGRNIIEVEAATQLASAKGKDYAYNSMFVRLPQ